MRRASEFLSPLPLAAVALLVANDHVFKEAFHNPVTGKVSDFAGCFGRSDPSAKPANPPAA